MEGQTTDFDDGWLKSKREITFSQPDRKTFLVWLKDLLNRSWRTHYQQ